ncbi:hypothetical protein PSU4_22260 [Pseudonocardia sulfidoxydans NBRC 16205]|uniref:OmpA-like domain-containing protein n=2 Tax=Pseudonocardia sulfidoxydans TaxID=54011 RepID=A0A511DES3_9PSEU|nr:OmpA family protein [Pseudonocardia sulfidoxydans]GEL23272.1 hypothetical protein PSU4_22260 [Pseudonocardia sulfidoxydans NBRC 16205]
MLGRLSHGERPAVLGAACIAVVAAATACTAPAAATSPVAATRAATRVLMVMGASANEPAPASTRTIAGMVRDAIASDDAVLDIAVDGPAGPVAHTPVDLVLRRGTQVEHDADRRARLTADLLASVGHTLATTAGSSGQVDTLGLLAHVARSPGSVTAVVFSSGLQSVGPLAIEAPGVGWDQVGTQKVVDAVVAQHLLPDLRGKTVVFSGIGDVAGLQPPLPDSVRVRLVNHWLGLCRAAGGDCRADQEPLPPTAPASTVPAPVVDVPALPPLDVARGDPIELPSAALFGPDSAALLPSASAVLATFARVLPADVRVRLDGRTATVPPADSARRFSLARAQACADALVAAGFPGDRITVRGLGYDAPLVADLDAGGRLVPDAAARNRSVTLTVTTNGGQP